MMWGVCAWLAFSACPAPSDRADAAVTIDAGANDAGVSLVDAGMNEVGMDGGVSVDGGMEFSCAGQVLRTVTIALGEEQRLVDDINRQGEKTQCVTYELEAGTFRFNNAITIRGKGITVKGKGKGKKGNGEGVTAPSDSLSTVLDFSQAAPNSNGVEFVGERFTISDLAIWNAKKDGLRVENSVNVAIQRVRAEWRNENDPNNGKYGIYPVKSRNVLVEDCEAYRSSDAGLYVGQTIKAIVRRNIAKENVAGIEIENTQFADVYENEASDNTCGLVAFDLPGNPIRGTDVRIYKNKVFNNNRANFASVGMGSSTVSQIPAGTGTFLLASRRVDVFENTFENNNTLDVAVLSGLAIEPDATKWERGGFNFPTTDVYVHKNTFQGMSGAAPDNGMPSPNRPLGLALLALYGQVGAAMGVARTEPLIFDGIGPMGASDLTNEAKACFAADNELPSAVTFAVGNVNFPASLPLLRGTQPDGGTGQPDPVAAFATTRRYAKNEAPFNCPPFAPAVVPVTLP
jgi:parallel beta-helix repeat protein